MTGNEDLRGTGLRGSAEVLEVIDTGRTVGLDNSAASTIYHARLRITSPGADPWEIEERTTSVPPVGTVAPVWVDPKRPDRVFVDTTALVEEQVAQAQRLAAQWAAAAPTMPPQQQPSGGADLVGELERLAALRDRGVISEDEFAAAKRSLLARDG